MRPPILMLLLAVIIVSGCTSISGEGFVVSLQADPPRMFSDGFSVLHIDVDNRQEKSVKNVAVELFDTGLLQGQGCSKVMDRMLPYEFQSLACTLYAPPMNESADAEVNVRTSFESGLSATQVFEVINEDEYVRRSASGSYTSAQQSYSYGDRNIRLDIEFSDYPPLVTRPGRQYFVYLTITNIGSGFISEIRQGDIVIAPANPANQRIIHCPVLEQGVGLYANGNAFPRIACEVMLPPFQVLSSINADFVVTIDYEYEVRNTLRISVAR